MTRPKTEAPAAHPETAATRAWAEIDLGALERNLKVIRGALPAHLRYIAVVKADAYGHGLAPAAARLMHSGADLFAVANLEEAARLREIGSGWPILVLSPLLPAEIPEAVRSGVLLTLSSAAEAHRLDEAARMAGQPVQAHLKIDTGMGRAGVWHNETDELAAALADCRNLRLAGAYTHFSDADGDPAFTALQRERFLSTLGRLGLNAGPNFLVHADNSAGLESFPPGGPYNAVRVGLLQVGVRPYPASLLGQVAVEPVLSFHARVGLVKEVPAGTAVSYGQTHRLAQRTRLAIVTAGYGDGVPLGLSNRGEVLIHGRRRPILGRVTMDQTVVDASVDPPPEAGDEALFIGRQGEDRLTAEEVAQAAETIPWDLFCSLTPRVRRIYRTVLGM